MNQCPQKSFLTHEWVAFIDDQQKRTTVLNDNNHLLIFIKELNSNMLLDTALDKIFIMLFPKHG